MYIPFTFSIYFTNYQLSTTKLFASFLLTSIYYYLIFILSLFCFCCVILLSTTTLFFFIIFNTFFTFFYLSSLQLQTKPHSPFFLLLACILHILHNPPPITSSPHIITLTLTRRSHLSSPQPSSSPLPWMLLSFYNKILYFFIFS